MGLQALCEDLNDSPITPYVEYFEDTWIGRGGRFGKRSKPLYSIDLWNQFENAVRGRQKTNNSVEGWHRAFQLGMGCAHPTVHKLINFMRRQQSTSENKIARFRPAKN